MRRRAVLGGLGAGLLVLAGCLSDGSDAGETETRRSPTEAGRDTPTATDSGTDCPPIGYIHVFDPGDIPDNATVHDAADAGFLENRHVADALERAQTTDSNEDQTVRGGSRRIASISGNEIANDVDVRDRLGYNELTYVTYSNRTYSLRYLVAEC